MRVMAIALCVVVLIMAAQILRLSSRTAAAEWDLANMRLLSARLDVQDEATREPIPNVRVEWRRNPMADLRRDDLVLVTTNGDNTLTLWWVGIGLPLEVRVMPPVHRERTLELKPFTTQLVQVEASGPTNAPPPVAPAP